MDYSLILVIETVQHNYDPVKKSFSNIISRQVTQDSDKGSFIGQSHKYMRFSGSSNLVRQIYHFGIIDYLQDWNLQKRAEHLSKHFFVGHDHSAIPPK